MTARLASHIGPVRPRAFFCGFMIGFALLCVVGRMVSGTNYIQGFQRFHRYLSMDTLYYATASQLRSLAAASASNGQVVVIVGGSSVMQGVGQGSKELWTDELQRLLGPSY